MRKEELLKIQYYKRYYPVEVDISYLYGGSKYYYMILKPPSFYEYYNTAFVMKHNIDYALLMKKIFICINYSNCIKELDDLILISKIDNNLIDILYDYCSLLLSDLRESEIRVINNIIDAIISKKDLNNVLFDNEEEEYIFKYFFHFVLLLWATQDENGIIKLNTIDLFKLDIMQYMAFYIVQSRAIDYKNKEYQKEIAKIKRRNK